CLCVGRDADARRYADLCIQLGQSRGVAPLPEVYGMLALRAGRFAEAAEHLIGGLSDELRAAAGAAVIEQFCAALADPANRSAALSALDAFERRATPEALD